MRKKKAPKRYLAPDARFNDPLVTRFINCLMFDEKKYRNWYFLFIL